MCLNDVRVSNLSSDFVIRFFFNKLRVSHYDFGMVDCLRRI